MTTFEIQTKIKFGQDALAYVSQYVDQKVFIVTDPFMVKSGMLQHVTKYLREGSYQVFSDIVPDPPLELVARGIEAVTQYTPQVIIALGGGSAIDAAKAIMDFAKKISHLKNMTFVAIPTTSGTGSEVTSFAVITNKEKGIKYPLVSNELLPDVAILDANLVQSVPPAIVADTGMDVLTHAVEAYVSKDATDFSDALAEKSVALTFEYLLSSYASGENIEARQKMHNASCMAGLAFNLTSLGANHAIAHVIGGKLHIPHGRTNALLLPHVIAYNAHIESYNPESYTLAAKKYANLARLVGLHGTNTRSLVKAFINEIIRMQKDMKMPQNIRECKIEASTFQSLKHEIASLALEDACIRTNPRQATKTDILGILESIS